MSLQRVESELQRMKRAHAVKELYALRQNGVNLVSNLDLGYAPDNGKPIMNLNHTNYHFFKDSPYSCFNISTHLQKG